MGLVSLRSYSYLLLQRLYQSTATLVFYLELRYLLKLITMEIRKMRETLNPITPETTPTMFFVSTAFRSSKHLKVKEYHGR